MTFLATTVACGHCLAAHSILVDLMMREVAPFAVEYHQCVQQLRPHFDLSLAVHYGKKMALCILYWLTQQFLYYLSERKSRRHPSLPDKSPLLKHLHTKMLDGFLGQLPASWSRSTPKLCIALAALVAHGDWASRSSPADSVTNTNYVTLIKKCWQASGHATIAQLLQVHTSEEAPPVPMVRNQSACLSWILKGQCFTNCPCTSTHKQASQALITQVHSLLDACGIAPSN